VFDGKKTSQNTMKGGFRSNGGASADADDTALNGRGCGGGLSFMNGCDGGNEGTKGTNNYGSRRGGFGGGGAGLCICLWYHQSFQILCCCLFSPFCATGACGGGGGGGYSGGGMSFFV